ncbi:hypothetical protein [Sphingopyxis granuli]|uniref:hypothetical protein n=2 Tax=Sphingomonadaceae TaxID=41297 RepID=UPI003C730F6A
MIDTSRSNLGLAMAPGSRRRAAIADKFAALPRWTRMTLALLAGLSAALVLLLGASSPRIFST